MAAHEVRVADPRRLERAALEVPGGRVVDRPADLPAEGVDAVVEVQVLAHVAGRGVQDVRRATHVLRRHDGLPVRPDLRQDAVGRLPVEGLMPERRPRRRDAAVRDVGARLPEQLAAVGVHRHEELDVGVLRDEIDDVGAFGLRQLRRPLVGVVDATRRRAVVAVEARADAVVTVEIHAPGGAPRRIGVVVRAVVGHVAPLGGEVVEAVVRAVGIVGRDQEDVGALDDLLGRGVRRVVAHEPFRGLERDRRRHPLAGVVLRLDQHAGLGAVAELADP